MLNPLVSSLAVFVAGLVALPKANPAGPPGAPSPSDASAPAQAQPDNAPAIQADLDEAARTGRAETLLPAGTFAIRRALRIPGGVALRGEGSGRTTLLLVANDTPRVPASPPGCPSPAPGALVPSGAIYNAGNRWFRGSLVFLPTSKACGEATSPPVPRDHGVGLRGLTVDCNARALWPGAVQSAGNGNAGCAFFDNVDGLTLDDVVLRDGDIDGLDLGLGDGVSHFAITRSRIEHNGRFGVGLVAGWDGSFTDTVLADNIAGGVDVEPIGPSLGAHDVLLRKVRIVGRRPSVQYDYGVVIGAPLGSRTSLRLEEMEITDVKGVGLKILWSGDYDVRFSGTIRRAGLGGVLSQATGPGKLSLAGRILDCGEQPGVLGPAVNLSGQERGWTIGPLVIHHGARWTSATNILLGPRSRDHVIRGVKVQTTSPPGAPPSNFVFQMGGVIHPSIKIVR